MHNLRTVIAAVVTGVAFMLMIGLHLEGIYGMTSWHRLTGNTIDWQLTDYSYDSDSTTITETDSTTTTDSTNTVITDSTTDSSNITTRDTTTTDTTENVENSDHETDTILSQETCPFSEKEGSIILDLSTHYSVEETVEAGVYSIVLASHYSRNIFETADSTHEGWQIVFKNRSNEVVAKSAVARMATHDEQLATELVNSRKPISSTVAYIQAQSESGGTDFHDTVPLCALLKYEAPVAEDSTTSDFQEKMEETKERFTEQKERIEQDFTEKKDASFTDFENSTVVTEGETHVVRETRTEENLVTVYTLDVGVYGTNTPITLGEQVVKRREALLSSLEDESLFDVLQEGREEIRKKVLAQVTEKNDVYNKGNILLKDRWRENASVDSEKVLEAFRYKKRKEFEHLIDTDGDGVTDYDEQYIYKTDPEHPFTSGTALTDGERILLNLDPTDSTYTTVPLESPQLSEQKNENLFTVEDITYTQEESEDLRYVPSKKVQISGQAQPLSFVTLYIYSTPIVVTVRTNEMGKFEYTLDKTLENGEHEMYVATVNSSGRILAKSDTIPFVKTAEAITYKPANVSSIDTPVDSALQKLLVLALLLVLLVAVGIILLVGYIKTHHDEERIADPQHEEETS